MKPDTKKITSWALLQSLPKLEQNNIKPEGACTTCSKAIWKAAIMTSETADENKEQDIRYYWIYENKSEGTHRILYCFCTLMHSYQNTPLAFCDGNPPEA